MIWNTQPSTFFEYISWIFWTLYAAFCTIINSQVASAIAHLNSLHLKKDENEKNKKAPLPNLLENVRTIRSNANKSIPLTCPSSFRTFIDKATSSPAFAKLANTNTDPLFYNPELYTKMVMESPDHVSAAFVNKWRRRKLLCTIQNFTLLVEYDPVKRGFQYSTTETIPYDVLNQAAMQFVKQFLCLDLYEDTLAATPLGPDSSSASLPQAAAPYRSPLIDLYEKYNWTRDKEYAAEAELHSMHFLGRSSTLAKRKQTAVKKETAPTEFVPPVKQINRFHRIRSVQDEITHSVQRVTQPQNKSQ